MITLNVEELDNHQRNAYGTTKWVTDYAGRNPVEGVNGMIKNDGSFNRASCRVFGLGACRLSGPARWLCWCVGVLGWWCWVG